MSACPTETRTAKPTGAVDLWMIIGPGAWARKIWPLGYLERNFLEDPTTFWTNVVNTANKPSVWRGLKRHAEVGGARYDEKTFTAFVDYTRGLPQRTHFTDGQGLSTFIEVGANTILNQGLLPAYFTTQIIEVEEGGVKRKETEYTPKTLNDIDLLRGELLAGMYQRFLTDPAEGLEPGFKHSFISKAAQIETTLSNLVWQLKLPHIGAGQLYQLSAQAESGETVTLQEAILAKMMGSLRGQYTGEQMAQLVAKSKDFLQKEIKGNRANLPLCRALAGCLRTVVDGAETVEHPYYSQYLAQKLALTKVGSSAEATANVERIVKNRLLTGLEAGQIEKIVSADKFSAPITASKLFWGELCTDLTDESYGYSGVVDLTNVFIKKLTSVITYFNQAPKEVQAAFIEIGREVLKRAVKDSKKSQLASVFESLVNGGTLPAGQKYLAEVRAADSATLVKLITAEVQDDKVGAGAEFSVVKYLRPEWERMIQTIANYPEKLQRQLLTASGSILGAIANEPNPVVQDELALLYTRIYADVTGIDQIKASEEKALELRPWIGQAVKSLVQELSESPATAKQRMQKYFEDLFDGLIGPCSFGDKVNLSKILLAFHKIVEEEMGRGKPDVIRQFVQAFMIVLENKIEDTGDEGLAAIYSRLDDAFGTPVSLQGIYDVLVSLEETKI